MAHAVQAEPTEQMQETTRTEQRQKPTVSLRVKILISFTMLFSLVFAVAFWWFYNFASGVAEQRLRQDLENALIGTAANLDGDVLVSLLEEAELAEGQQYPDDPRYWEIAEFLYNVHEIDQNAWPYTYVKGEGLTDVVYVVSSGAVAPEPWGVTLGYTEDAYFGNMQQGICLDIATGHQTESCPPTTFLDVSYEWRGREWVSGFAPIYSETTGEVVAGLGIDYAYDYVREVRNNVRNQIIPAFIITYGVLFIFVFIMSAGLTRPIVSLTRIAERIGEGDYNQDLSATKQGWLRDEITTLTEVFETMIGKVAQREVRLKEKVAELQIIVDKGKRDRQVSEIVDSDFFQDLQNKAKVMRQRKGRSDRSTS